MCSRQHWVVFQRGAVSDAMSVCHLKFTITRDIPTKIEQCLGDTVGRLQTAAKHSRRDARSRSRKRTY